MPEIAVGNYLEITGDGLAVRAGPGSDHPLVSEFLLDEQSGCWLVPSLISAGEWLILRTSLGGLCGEGTARSFGPHLARTDAGDWEPLPLSSPDADGAGSWVAAAEVFDGTLVLAGESDGQATFWWAGE